MKVLLALDKLRGTFTARQACGHLARGMRQAFPDVEIEQLPLADGGEGTLDLLLESLGGTPHAMRVTGPLGDPVIAEYGVAPDGTALIESARCCGLELVPFEARDPLRASSRGLGEMMAACLDAGLRKFVIGLGGSATVDGGAGMARALGFGLLGTDGAPIQEGAAGLQTLVRIDDAMAHPALTQARVTALADVENSILGPAGSVAVYAPQKGASAADLPVLERGLERLVAASALWRAVDRSTLADFPRGGAAGGLGLACHLFLGADLLPGAIWLMELVGFADKVEGADLVVTGEGSFDAQSLHGKTAARVLEAAAQAGRPAALVAGRWDGTLPLRRPPSLRVFTPADSARLEEKLDGEALCELGRAILAWADTLA